MKYWNLSLHHPKGLPQLQAIVIFSLGVVTSAVTLCAFFSLGVDGFTTKSAIYSAELRFLERNQCSTSLGVASNVEDGSIDTSSDNRLRRVRLPRAPGIEWGTDLSFSFVYVRALEPSGAAFLSGLVEKGDQICELKPVLEDSEVAEAINLIGAPFDEVMESFASIGREVRDVDLVFFRGTKDELKAACAGGDLSESDDKITITVVQNKGSKDECTRQIEAKSGCNIREVLTNNGINVYQSVTRWTNCKGKQLCGTCIINIIDGSVNTNRKSLDESSTLRENPESYRLSCVTFAYGNITVETFPPIEAAQWTR